MTLTLAVHCLLPQTGLLDIDTPPSFKHTAWLGERKPKVLGLLRGFHLLQPQKFMKSNYLIYTKSAAFPSTKNNVCLKSAVRG